MAKRRPATPAPLPADLLDRVTPELSKLAAIADDLQRLVDGGIQPVCAQQVQLNINNLKDAAHDIANAMQGTIR